MERDIFLNISPLDHRYWLSDEKLFDQLGSYLSWEATIRYQAQVEVALMKGLAKAGVCPGAYAEQVRDAVSRCTCSEVMEEEKKTKHDIRALVNCIRDKVEEGVRPFVHLGITSADVVDTANAHRLKACTEVVVLPLLEDLRGHWKRLAREESDTVQIGRTHGQYAVPITFGFALAGYVSRLSGRIELIREGAKNLRGKIAGGVGAYNALSLVVQDPKALEREVLAELGLRPADHATQIVQPEPTLDLFHAFFSAFGVLANFADDMRHLQRSEIGEVAEAFSASQVGSSTMPHKKNPWNFENVKSMWKTFVPRVLCGYMDQISEHQRDLTNSASSRFAFEVVAGLCAATSRLSRISRDLVVDRDAMARHLEEAAKVFGAEPLYVFLSLKGHPDAHEVVRQLAMRAREKGTTLIEELDREPSLQSYAQSLTPSEREKVVRPGAYIGWASRVAKELGAPEAGG